MEVTVTDYASAERSLRRSHSYTHLVSCRNKYRLRGPVDPLGTVPHSIELNFDDVGAGDRAPAPSDVQRLLTWAALTKSAAAADKKNMDHYLFQCGQGISRSAGCAVAVLAYLYGAGEEWQVFQTLHTIRPTAHPHPRLIQYADELLSRGGRLIEINDEIQRRRRNVYKEATTGSIL